MTYPTMVLDHLQSVMNAGGIDDHEIAQGVELSRIGYQKLAGKMGVNIKEIGEMVNELMVKVRGDQSLEDETIEEGVDEKFTYERDILGNMTVRDTETGDENYVEGSEAAELYQALRHHPDQAQAILAHYMADGETTVMEEDEPGVAGYDHEIDDGNGTYNFPWKAGSKHGTATVEYYAKSGKPVINLISVRDAAGEEVQVRPALEAELKKQAVAFIGDA